MKELANQYKPQICPLQRDLSLVVLSHLAHRRLATLNDKPSSIIDNVSAPRVKFTFQNEDEAAEILVKAVMETVGILWDESTSQSAKERQLIDKLLLLKKQGISRTEIVERLNSHFRWSLNSQKI